MLWRKLGSHPRYSPWLFFANALQLLSIQIDVRCIFAILVEDNHHSGPQWIMYEGCKCMNDKIQSPWLFHIFVIFSPHTFFHVLLFFISLKIYPLMNFMSEEEIHFVQTFVTSVGMKLLRASPIENVLLSCVDPIHSFYERLQCHI